jgi:serine/threonine protein kinase
MNERSIFDAALEIADPIKRNAFIENACQGNLKLRADVESLLASHEQADSFLEKPLLEDLAASSIDELAKTAAFSHDATAQGKRASSPTRRANEEDLDGESIDLSFLQPPTKPNSIGTLGHYDVQSVLGQGGFGIVLKAFDEKLHRLVAIKVMNPQMAATSPPRKRFLREARAAAGIKHENIVQVYSVEESPLPYLVMEYIDGETLHGKQDDSGPLDVDEVVSIGRQIASGLAAAHTSGLIHRDIKPGNILLEQGDERKVKITDFGLARTADDASMTRTGMISGTPMYMAPEQAMGLALDQRADLFSMGSVLYQLSCGRPPFRASTAVAVLRRVAEDTPRPLQEIIPELPDWLVAIINRLLAKNPDDRYQTAREVAELLGRCEAELKSTGKVTCVPVPKRLHSQITTRRTKTKTWVALLMGLGLAASLLFAQRLSLLPFTGFPESTRSTQVNPTPLVAKDPDRDAAEWIIGNGGDITLLTGNRLVSHLAELPAEPFRILGASVRNVSPFSVVDAQRLAACKEFRYGVFQGTSFAPGSIAKLSECQQLDALTITDGQTAASTFEEVLQLSQLQNIDFNGVSVTNDLCGKLGQLRKLSHLQFYGCRELTADGLETFAVSPPPKLKELILAQITLPDSTLQAVSEMPHLQRLSLGQSTFSIDGLMSLKRCATLSSLILFEASAKQPDIAELQRTLNECQIFVSKPELAAPAQGDEYQDTIRKLMARGYNALVTTNATLGNQWISGEDSFPPGEVVYVTGIDGANLNVKTEPADLALLAKLSDLPWINLLAVPENGLRELLPLKNLNYVALEDSSLTDADIALLPSFTKLSELRLTIPDDEAMEVIAKLPQLRVLVDRGSKITDKALNMLESAKLLSELHLAGTNVSSKAVQAFANARPDVKVIGTDYPLVSSEGIVPTP